MTASGEPLAASLSDGSADLGTAFLAIAERRHLLFEYRSKPRRVCPFGLVHRRGHWYLVGDDGGTTKVFRMDRATEVEAGQKPDAFARPAGFRAAEFIPETSWEAGGEDLEARVRFDPEMAWWAQRQIGDNGRVEERSDGSIEAVMPVANPEAFIGWLLSFEDKAELVHPVELRDRLVARVRGAS